MMLMNPAVALTPALISGLLMFILLVVGALSGVAAYLGSGPDEVGERTGVRPPQPAAAPTVYRLAPYPERRRAS